MSAELDIDGLHTQLEEAPNDQDALTALIGFYEKEGAIEELMELYLTQLEAQTEERMPLYVGLSDLMRQHLNETENARLVTLEGLQEFQESPALLTSLDLLSTTSEERDEFIVLLKAASIDAKDVALHQLLNAHIHSLSHEEFEKYVQTLREMALNHEDAEHLMALLESVDERSDAERTFYLSELTQVAVELKDMSLVEGLIPFVNELNEDAFDTCLQSLKARAIEDQSSVNIVELLSFNDTASTIAVVADVAIALDDEPLLMQLMPHSAQLNDIDFTLYISKLEDLSIEAHSLAILEQLESHATEWSDERKLDLQTRLGELTVKVSSPLEILLQLPQISTISEERAADYADDAKRELVATASLTTVVQLIESVELLGNDELGALLLDIYKNQLEEVEITAKIQDWFMSAADAELLDQFIDTCAASSEDFDAISLLMRQRAERTSALGEDDSVRRSWQQRALSLNPSETGLHDYFEHERTLDHQELNFLTNFVSDDQTDPRIGLRAMLRALEFERETENLNDWLEMLVFAYRRSATFDADHQKAIKVLLTNGATEIAAQLLIESATAETNEKIQRALFLDSGDHLLITNPKEAARCYYKAFETKNDDRVILSKLLDAYQRSEEWAKSIKVLKKLASLEDDMKMRAKYLYAMGVIQRDKQHNHLTAVRTFDRALDADPSMVKAIQAIDEVITNDEDYERQDRYYRKCLARAIEHSSDERVIFQLAQNLATLSISKLHNDEAAIKALKVARAHTTKTAEVDKQLLSLYRSNGDLENALAFHYHELAENPLKVRFYKQLFVTLRAFGLNESAACVDRTLTALGQAPQVAPKDGRSSRSAEIRHFGQHTWKILRPEGFDSTLNEVFSLLSEYIRHTYALADDAYRFSRPEPLGPSTIPSVFTEVVSRLRVPLPAVWFSTESAPVSLVHRTVPALVLGPSIDKLGVAEQRFLASRILMLTKPEYFLATHPSPLEERVEHLRDLFNGCVQLTKTGKLGRKDSPLVKRVLANVGSKEVLSLTQILGNSAMKTNEDVRQWLQHVDLMASRVGFMLTDNLDVGLRMTRELTDPFSDLTVENRLTDLLLFSVSRDFLLMRGDLSDRIRE